MARLAETFAWAEEADLQPLRQAVRCAGLSPLRAIGSGGSLTGAHALVGLHQRYTGHLAAAATPLESVDEPLDATAAMWLLSAGGRNADITTATKTLILREPRQIAVLCGHETSPLANLCRQHPFVDLLLYSPPAGRDGFLATNSLFGFAALLTRAYAAEFGSDSDWRDAVDHLKPLLTDAAAAPEIWEADTVPLWTKATTLVLHGPSTRIGAIDLESKFTEAALGHVQHADYRSFAHGRHNWLAKRGETSAVLAFIADADRALAERTLDLIPDHVPQARIVFDGGSSAVALASLLAALRITEWAGRTPDVDPGRPGIPVFGRKIYNLRPPRPRRIAGSPRLAPRKAAAIARKVGCDPDSLTAGDALDHWRNALEDFLTRLRAPRFAGIVLDYDGTIVDTRRRTELADPAIASELARLSSSGVPIGIATGRGVSARHHLRACLPRQSWPLVMVGYYNGAEVAPLDDDGAPNGTKRVSASLRPFVDALRRQPDISEFACLEERPFQVTLEARHATSEFRLWKLIHQLILTTRSHDIHATLSDHSVDIVAAGVSKLNVVQRLRESIGDEPILTIGDRGRWPGNDHELLSETFALGVDQVSTDPLTCWHLGEPGQRGPNVTLDYLTALQTEGARLQFTVDSLQ